MIGLSQQSAFGIPWSVLHPLTSLQKEPQLWAGHASGGALSFLKGLLKAISVDGKMNEKFRTWLNGVICVTITLKKIFLGKKIQKESSMI